MQMTWPLLFTVYNSCFFGCCFILIGILKEAVSGVLQLAGNRWSCLAMGSMVLIMKKISTEFTRLVSMDLSKSFYESLDKYDSKLLYLYHSRHYADIAEMSAILESLDKNASNHRKRVAVLLGLPLYMQENPSHFLMFCEHTDSEEEIIKGMTVGIITVVDDMMDPILCDCSDVALVIEVVIVLRNIGDVPNTFVNLMGLLYALNINYSQNFKYTFEVIQRLFMNIGADACNV
ncbi:uncharacterized protein LOC128617104 [Ictalurus furcatus]|uniref:uncharacterized protein LOC128617104 n=1 Tax=Ictalurus furcatus TaxID=66913 RepID=UPI00235081AB|nr:uncharacterized protein LOC128617104 [Ictalurus furcatus]